MIRKFFYSVIKFQPIGLSQGNKIKQNQIIQYSKTNAELFKFYQEFGKQLNLINVVSYIRKYTDNMISNDELENEIQIQHAFQTLTQLKEMINTESYKKFGDKETDHKRSFIMLLSLSVELTLRTRSEKNQAEFLNYAKLAIQKLKEEDRLHKCNIDELSVFLRCITQINELNPSESEEIEYWGLINKHSSTLTPHIASKLLHSLSKFKTFNENLIEKLLGNLNQLESNDINQKDANSLFFSFKHIYEKSKIFHETIQKLFLNLQVHMLRQYYKLNSKQIGMIYNVLATLPITVKPEFLNYLQAQLIQANSMTMLCLAHLFQFYQTQIDLQISPNLEKKIVTFLQQTQIQNIYESEQFIMFFNSLGKYCTTNYIEAVIKIMKTLPLNDFVLGKIFSGLLKIPLTVDHYTDLCQISVTLLQKYDNIINIHSLNSIYRGQCILNARFSQIIQQVVDYQINQYSQQILVEDYLKLIEAKQYFQSFEFLQVLYDFLKIYTFTGIIGQKNKEIISQKLKILKVTIQAIKNDRLKENVGPYIEQLDQFID